MDFLNKRLRDEIIALRKSIDAIRDQQERHYQEEKAQREVPPPPVRVEPEIREVPAEQTKHDPYQKDSLRVQWITAIATSLAFFAAAYYAGVAKGQLKQMRIATQAATDAADVATKQLALTSQQLEYTQAAKLRLSLQLGFAGKDYPASGADVSPQIVNIGHESASNGVLCMEISKHRVGGKALVGNVKSYEITLPNDLWVFR